MRAPQVAVLSQREAEEHARARAPLENRAAASWVSEAGDRGSGLEGQIGEARQLGHLGPDPLPFGRGVRLGAGGEVLRVHGRGLSSYRARCLAARSSPTLPKAGGAPAEPILVTILLQGCGAVRLRHMKPGTRVSVRDALQLRAAALDLLGGGRPDWTRLAHCSTGTWSLVLRTERCALALKSRLGALGLPVPDEIERVATRERQRILSARGQLRRIGQLAAAHGMAGVVLKGGVAALTSSAPVDLHDVDVLVRPPAAERLAALLDKEGFHATGPAGTAHLTQRVSPNAVQIEVHFALNEFELSDAMWARARPLNGTAGLSRLGAADHVWHLLVHSVVTHPHRRGALRDVLLVAEAVRDCSPAEVEDVERRCASHRLGRALRDVLAMARGLGGGGPVRDRFPRE